MHELCGLEQHQSPTQPRDRISQGWVGRAESCNVNKTTLLYIILDYILLQSPIINVFMKSFHCNCILSTQTERQKYKHTKRTKLMIQTQNFQNSIGTEVPPNTEHTLRSYWHQKQLPKTGHYNPGIFSIFYKIYIICTTCFYKFSNN